MSVRLIISITATPGNGDALGTALRARTEEVVSEPGCEQYEIFRSLNAPDHFVLLEKWQDAASLEAHAERLKTREPLDRSLIAGTSQREDYSYNRTR